MLTLERKSAEIPIVDYVGRQSYDDLLHDAQIIAKEYDVDEDLQHKTLELLDEMCAYDEDVAIGGLRTLPIATEIADSIGEYYDIEINQAPVFAGSLLHDIGKIGLPKELLTKSSNGQEWTVADALTMQQHIYFGGMILRKHCLPMSVIRPVEEHHHKQKSSTEYGIDPHLNNQERIYRDVIAIADFAEADINRTNTRNHNLSRAQREEEITTDIAYVLDDYLNNQELVDRIVNCILRVA